MKQQPFVHDLVVALAAPVQAWSRADGTFAPDGISGLYLGDRRIVSDARLEIADADGQPVDMAHLGAVVSGGADITFSAMVRTASENADPLVALTRHRRATPQGIVERIEISSAIEDVLRLGVSVTVTPDATPLNLIKAGEPVSDALDIDGLTWSWGEDTRAHVSGPGAVAADQCLHWDLAIEPNSTVEIAWQLEATDASLPFVACAAEPLPTPSLTDALGALTGLVRRSVASLNALRLAEPAHPACGFEAAGAPWFLTLFGRDSLISARLFLPVDHRLALDTLRVLAARQGREVNAERAEAPGKILHEVRADKFDLREGTILPPEYYGTIDATCLWIVLLGQVWRAGASHDEISSLMDPLVAALGWLRDHSDPDGDGFLEYYDATGHGLANQGWKDSGDSMRFADGTVADSPIALAEVQGYAFHAARTASELLREFGRNEAERGQADEWDVYADAMETRFRDRFWVERDGDRYPALALDAHKQPIDAVASNMGHLIATGILNDDEIAAVVERLMRPDMFSGYGIRTISTGNGRYWPTRYHVGSVWTHDTAMAIEGMLAAGYEREARTLAEGLLAAAEGFGGQLPELFGGQDAAEAASPSPYPASCHPQAWAAASAVTIAQALGALAT